MEIDVVRRLQKLVEKGYLLHGSRFKFKFLKPNKKNKLHPKAGLLKAVYATDSVDLAMFKAVLDASKMPKVSDMQGGAIGWGFPGDKPKFWVTPNYVTYKAFGKGYVYVVSGDCFKKLKKLPHEYYSNKSSVPFKIIEVKANSFLKRNTLKIWPEEELRKRKRYTEEEIQMMGY